MAEESYLSRLSNSKASYTDPNGNVFPFLFDNLRRRTRSNNAIWTLPESNALSGNDYHTYVQELGPAENIFPMRIIFAGKDQDIVGNAFLESLLVPGVGFLEHPLFGSRKVLPIRQFLQDMNATRRLGVTFFDIIWVETLSDKPFPDSSNSQNHNKKKDLMDIINAIFMAIHVKLQEIFEAINAAIFGNRFLKEAMIFIRFITSLLNDIEQEILQIEQALGAIAKNIGAFVAAVNRLFDITADSDSGQNGIDSSGRGGATGRMGIYAAYIRVATGNGDRSEQLSDYTNDPINKFIFLNVFVVAAFMASTSTIFRNPINSRREAMQLASDLKVIFEQVVNWQQLNINSLNLDDDGQLYDGLYDLYSVAIGKLQQIATQSKIERQLVLESDITLIDFAAQRMQDISPQVLDELIRINNIVGQELFILRAGREMVFLK